MRFRRVEARQPVTITVNGTPLQAATGDSVATALLAAGYTSFGASAPGTAPVSPVCLMGVCFRCLLTVDGRPGEQACLAPVRDGLAVETAT